MSSNEYIFLEHTLHKNYINFELTEEIMSNLFVTKDGTVMAVKEEYLKDLDSNKINLNLLGYKKDDDFIPKKISSEEDLKKVLYCCSLE